MDAKNVHSRAYHSALTKARKDGKEETECKDLARKAAREAVASMTYMCLNVTLNVHLFVST